MKEFKDSNNNLIWINFHDNANENIIGLLSFIKAKILNKSSMQIFSHQDAIKTLNTWNDLDTQGNIKKFINKNHNLPLGDFLEHKYFLPLAPEYLSDDSCQFYQYFAYQNIDNNPTLVGTVLINHTDKFEFKNYIEYLIVNPEFQRKGIGTRMLSSIIENPDKFTHSDNPEDLIGYIHKDNTASLHLVKKLGFKEFAHKSFWQEDYLLSSQYYTYIYNIKEMNFDRPNK